MIEHRWSVDLRDAPKKVGGRLNCVRIAAALLVTCSLAVAAHAQEFSATGMARDTTGRIVKSKVYMSGKKVRYDPQETASANEQGYNIVDLTQRTSTVINTGRKSYMQRPATSMDLQVYTPAPSPCPPALPAGASCKDQGSEMVNGRNAEKWEMDQSAQGQNIVSRIWVDAKLHVWIKVETMTGNTVILSNELQDIKEGPQPPSLFEIPSDYQKQSLY
jgi:hypothetical protein